MKKLWMLFTVLLIAGCGTDSQDSDDEWAFCERAPVCPEGTYPVSEDYSCPSGMCEEIRECGETIFCEEQEICDGMPTCRAGWERVLDESKCEYESCEPRSWCGFTIQCQNVSTCAAMPACPAGATEISDQSECPADTACWEIYDEECGGSIWCWEGVDACEIWPPECPEGATQVAQQSDCPQGDVDCFEVYDETCEETIWCWEEAELCLGLPACPQDMTEVETCPDDDQYPCKEETLCGVTIYCVDYQP